MLKIHSAHKETLAELVNRLITQRIITNSQYQQK